MFFVTGAGGNAGSAVVHALLGSRQDVQPTVREVLGREPRAYERWVEENAEALHAAAA